MASQSNADDSDATVAPDEEADFRIQNKMQEAREENDLGDRLDENSQVIESDGSVANSPSILHPNRATSSQIKCRDIVPCSSDEGTDEILSQEYPPLIEWSKSGGEQAKSISNLSQIEKDQGTLVSEIERVVDNYGEIFPSHFVKDAKMTVSEVERKLRVVSETHQAERKKLEVAYARLSQGSSSREGVAAKENSESLRTQLVSLSARQKQLLQCFKKQKEISSKLGKLVERETKAKKIVTVGSKGTTPNKYQTPSHAAPIILPNLVKHLQLNPLPQFQTQTTDTPSIIAAVTKAPASQVQSSQDTIPLTPSIAGQGNASGQAGEDTRTGQISATGQGTRTEQSGSSINSGLLSSSILVQSAPLKRGLGDNSQTANVKAMGSVSSSEFTQPVPLSALIDHNILKPGPRTLTCTILGCDFTGSLLKDGAIQEIHTHGSPGSRGQTSLHQLPHQWARSCWSRLGHCHKRTNRKQAYTVIFYEGKPLTSYCEEYSLKQVSSYLSHKKSTQRKLALANEMSNQMNNATNNENATSAVVNPGTEFISNMKTTTITAAPTQSDFSQLPIEPDAQVLPVLPQPPPNSVESLLVSGEVLLVSSNYQSLRLPCDFWEEGKVLPQTVVQQIQDDLDW